jgi:hypothetical protein
MQLERIAPPGIDSCFSSRRDFSRDVRTMLAETSIDWPESQDVELAE